LGEHLQGTEAATAAESQTPTFGQAAAQAGIPALEGQAVVRIVPVTLALAVVVAVADWLIVFAPLWFAAVAAAGSVF
jgi:hypothetical protein